MHRLQKKKQKKKYDCVKRKNHDICTLKRYDTENSKWGNAKDCSEVNESTRNENL